LHSARSFPLFNMISASLPFVFHTFLTTGRHQVYGGYP
jgi:hypothetical protein